MKKEVQILVFGSTATGKTTISQLIQKTLIEHGIKNVEVFDDMDGSQKEETYSKRINALAEHEEFIVKIKTGQISRTGNINLTEYYPYTPNKRIHICPKCNIPLNVNKNLHYLTSPAQYKFFCETCGFEKIDFEEK